MEKHILYLIVLILSTTSYAQNQDKFAPNEIIVKLKSNADYKLSAPSIGCILIEKINDTNKERWCVPDTLFLGGDTLTGVENIANYFNSMEALVEYAEPNYVLEGFIEPNDPDFPALWGMTQINAPEAWDTQTGSSDVVVGVLDSGIDWKHPDLIDNIWQNLAEDADGDGSVLEWTGVQWVFDPDDVNGIDDDGNGFIDDFIGWDFKNDDNMPNESDCAHGTHVGGIIGAKGNNGIGVCGGAWNVKMMALKFLEYDPLEEGCTGYTADAVKALKYAVEMGAQLSNNSWGGPSFSMTLKEAIDSAALMNHLFVASAGNQGDDMDIIPSYPAAFNSPNIISVGATDMLDEMYYNTGLNTVDLCAPGINIYSTSWNNTYDVKSGTSMSAPHVAAVASLILSECPELSNYEVKEILMNSVDVVPNLVGLSVTGGRLNAEAAVLMTQSFCQASLCPLESDSLVLVALYDATDGTNWTNTWDLTQAVSTWYGISLSEDECSVIEIDLGGNNLIGIIPSEIGNLNSLQKIFLDQNQLSGSIPTALGNLNNLTALWLFGNQLSGNIPSQLGNLSDLQQLYLNINQLSGSIPPALGNLNNLWSLYLNNNQLSGNIPDELGNLTEYVDIITFGLAIWLQNNQLNGCIPTSFQNHCSDADVLLNNNPALAWQGDFDQFCTTSGDITDQIGAPCDDGNVLTINDLISADCECVGTLVEPPCLESDSLDLIVLYNATDGGNWTSTWDLALPVNTWFGVSLGGDGCSVVGIDLFGNNLTGNMPSDLGNLENLEDLNLGFNNLTGTIPPELGNLQNLEHLHLRLNGLTGSIPPELGSLESLLNLNLSRNELTGIIPPELGNLSNIFSINLEQNNLTGNIPALENLPNLSTLDLSVNELTGDIPPELGDLQALLILNVSNNELTGNIPAELGNAPQSVLILSDNQLSGCIPENLYSICSDPIPSDFSNNVALAWQGDLTQFCATAGTLAEQIGAPCDDGISSTTDDVITADCECLGTDIPFCELTIDDFVANLPITLCGNFESSFEVTTTGNYGENVVYIITDNNNNIIQYQENITDDLIVIEEAGFGITYHLWAMTYDGPLMISDIGDPFEIFNECFALSNPIELFFWECFPAQNCNAADIDLGEDLFLDCEASLTITTGLSEMEHTLWDHNGVIYAINQDSIEATLPGLYIAFVTDICGNTGIDSIFIEGDPDCIWPGDVNNDLVVNHLDVLPWSLDYDKIGLPRETVGVDWIGQNAGEDWIGQNTNGVNDKYSDCNGDGVITFEDVEAVYQNYGRTHGLLENLEFIDTDALLDFSINDSETVIEDGTIGIDLVISENTTPISAFACKIQISNALNNVSFEYVNEWFGIENQEVYVFTKYDSITQVMDIAIARIDGNNIIGDGGIGRLVIEPAEVVGAWGDDSENSFVLSMGLEEVVMMDNQGELFSAGYGNKSDDFIGVFSKELVVDNVVLQAGWNLIGLNIEPFQKNIAGVFSSLKSDNLQYVASFEKDAVVYAPNNMYENSLVNVKTGQGYWVNVLEADTLEILGTPILNDFQDTLNAAWNLKASSSQYDYTTSIYFEDQVNNDNLIAANTFKDGEFKTYNFNEPNIDGFNLLEGNQGYWVKVVNPVFDGNATANLNKTNVFSFYQGTCNLPQGEQISVQTMDGLEVGVFEVLEGGNIATTSIYGDDFTTDILEGPLRNDTIVFVWNEAILNIGMTYDGFPSIETIELNFLNTAIENISLKNNYLVYPNPFSQQLTIEIDFSIHKDEEIVLEIFDLGGVKIKELLVNIDATNTELFNLELDDLLNGLYVLKITTSQEQFHHRIVKIEND